MMINFDAQYYSTLLSHHMYEPYWFDSNRLICVEVYMH